MYSFKPFKIVCQSSHCRLEIACVIKGVDLNETTNIRDAVTEHGGGLVSWSNLYTEDREWWKINDCSN